MNKLPIISSKKLVKILKRNGFIDAPVKAKGSHTALLKVDNNRKYLVIIPMRNPIPKGTLLSIILQSDLTKEEFMKLLEK